MRYLILTLGLLAVLCSMMVIVSGNPIHSILYLILVFCNITFILIILKMEFVAIIFLIVYVGAIAVLFLFVVMMLNIKIFELDVSSWRYIPIGLAVSCLFLFQVFLLLPGHGIFEWFGLLLDNDSDLFIIKHIAFKLQDEYLFSVLRQNLGPISGSCIFDSELSTLLLQSLSTNYQPLLSSEDLTITGSSQLHTVLNRLGMLMPIEQYVFLKQSIWLQKILPLNLSFSFDMVPSFMPISDNGGEFFYLNKLLPLSGGYYDIAYSMTNTELLGQLIYTHNFFLFLIISIIMLVSMIGSIVIVLNQNINLKRQLIFRQTLQDLKESVKLDSFEVCVQKG
jgi:NADH:ubiquinone oxidoreductase subunit 6 (subunit J)